MLSVSASPVRETAMKYTETEYYIDLGRQPNEYERLRFLCKLYRGKRIKKHQFVRELFNLFADDHGMDWCDDFKSLKHLAQVIVASKKVQS